MVLPQGAQDRQNFRATLMVDVWRARKIILSVTLLAALAAAVYAFLAQQWFRAEVVLAPANRSAAQSGLAQLGGIASIAGITLDQGSSAQTPIAVLRSRSLAADFIAKNGLVDLMQDRSFGRCLTSWSWTKSAEVPDIRDSVKFFDERIRTVVEDRKTGLISLAITWTDANQAASWANQIVRDANERLRNQAEKEAERNIAYLQQQLNAATVPALQQSIGKILESEMQKLLLAKGNEEFAFKVIDAAVAPRKRTSPNRLSLILGAFFLSFVSSVIYLAIRREFHFELRSIGAGERS